MDLINGREISFQFRDHQYKMYRDSNLYVYSRIKDSITDILHSRKGFNRVINGTPVLVADSMAAKYSASVNSVLYFFQLPFVLNDAAARKEYIGRTTIEEMEYHILKVTFNEEGGGEDFEDEFRYWINTETFEIDFLAYSYLTDDGGIRFREAFNKQRFDGILFQDYRNFKPASLQVPLDSLPVLFERQELKLLSKIENKDIQVVKQ
ncbi:MAG: deoxyribose-phosphate aldolase [Bacteroidia bacterium]|nr:deoxyribose-phosphate aldolase [Bacteroidia bacterium]NNF30981.1 deoxyribose-phosphate aldolase [Flavobacteriaceae bacterium]MBT8274943.1 deoxyribose-phosphate aldolase [Bacteroidia bacterium]NNJ82626.1 deoxyribose-phosphate aldolase [Flavobacteriaceae bacterium]NNK53132.1 deoxyribose-phosphate aldolase [Flavobacteriaceae bacterium]